MFSCPNYGPFTGTTLHHGPFQTKEMFTHKIRPQYTERGYSMPLPPIFPGKNYPSISNHMFTFVSLELTWCYVT